MKQTVAECENLGYHHILLPDHLGYITPDNTIFEIWTALSALAAITKKVRLESLVICNNYRNPALVAKMGATLDVISNGRLILGYGAGWNDKEYRGYGIPFAKPVISALWTNFLLGGLSPFSFTFLVLVYRLTSMLYMNAFAVSSFAMFFRVFAMQNSPNACLNVE